jgi:hypothetical protein
MRPSWAALLLTALFAMEGCTSRYTTPSSVLVYPAGLHVVPRETWGWQASTPGSDTLLLHTIRRITIHHSGEDFSDDENTIAYLRRFQQWCRTEKHWIDIPYHFMIDLQGTIYEARRIELPGDTNTDYDVRGHALICVLGNYEHQWVSAAQLDALVRLTAFLADQFDVPVDSVRAHRDYTETLCPGAHLYQFFQDGTFRQRVTLQRHVHQQ